MRTPPSPFSLPPTVTAAAADPEDCGANDSDLWDPEEELGRSKYCSSGLGCIRVKGNSATSSLDIKLACYLRHNGQNMRTCRFKFCYCQVLMSCWFEILTLQCLLSSTVFTFIASPASPPYNEESASRAWYQHCRKWPFWVEVANPEHPFTAMLISRSRGTCLFNPWTEMSQLIEFRIDSKSLFVGELWVHFSKKKSINLLDRFDKKILFSS